MLFNSAGFLFFFLPLTLAAFAGAVRLRSPGLAVAVLLAASYVFYGWWEPQLAFLLFGSTAVNYALGSAILAAKGQSRRRVARLLLWLGIAGDLALLGYCKYAGFFVATLDQLAGATIAVPAVALPVGISFYTFTQIAFLVDAARGAVERLKPGEYFLFVSYFPHLVAGPIIHHRATLPQFRRMAASGWEASDVAMGLSIFALGLFKKIALADQVAPFADHAFNATATGSAPAMLDAWIGAFAYAFQIYFDFSGYSDMAIGLSLLFGVRLPLNFASPYKAASLIEFWQRWHISLSRFLRDYLYIPLGGNRRGPARRYGNLLATMLLGGLWHGAGWTFLLWGGLHGLYLAANHALRRARPPRRGDARLTLLWAKRAAVLLAVTIAWVLFRADSLAGAAAMFRGMSGFAGAGHLNRAEAHGLLWLALCLAIVWGLPNTWQLWARFAPTLSPDVAMAPPAGRLAWRPSRAWAVASAATLAGTILALSRLSPFLYFRF